MRTPAVPAKAGTHLATGRAADRWVRALAGSAILAGRPWLFLIGLMLAVSGCVSPPPVAAPPGPPPVASSCLLPSQQPMVVAELFFGRDKDGRRNVSDVAWADFLSTVVTPSFPDGLTVFDGYGQWRNPATGVIGRSPRVKIVLIAVRPAADLADRLSAVIEAYKARFRQQSVGIITRDSCAAF